MSKLLDLGAEILEKVDVPGDIELYMGSDKNIDVGIQRDEINMSRCHEKEQVGIRYIQDGKLGFTSLNSLDKDAIINKIKEAVKLARSSIPDKHNNIPSPMKVKKLDGLYDKDIENFGVEDGLEYGKNFLHTALEADDRFRFNEGFFASHDVERAVINSKGIAESERSSGFHYLGIGLASSHGEVSNMDVKAGGSITIKDIDVESVARELVLAAVDNLGAEKGKSFEGVGIFSPHALAQILFMGLLYPLKGNRVVKGLSPMGDKLEEQIASGSFTLIDDASKKDALRSRSFDREGLPTPKMTVVEDGVLKSLFHNSYTASAMETVSTGHASGGPRSVPYIDPTNLVVKPGNIGYDSMIEQVEHGVLINRFSGDVDPVSGDFSGVVKGGHMIKGGEIVHPLKQMMVSGNVFDLFTNISNISSDIELVVTVLCMELPYVRVEDLSFVSG